MREKDINITITVVATTRRLASDSGGGAFVDWAATSSSAANRSVAAPPDDLSLGFNATGQTTGGIFSGASTRSINYNLAPPEMGMVGLRDLFVVTPASTFHHQHEQPHFSDHPHHHSINNSSNPATALGVGIIPLLAATPCLDNETMMGNRNHSSGATQGIQFWQDQQPHHYFKTHNVNGSQENYVQSGGTGDGGGVGLTITGSGTNSGGTMTCQDCGNQAKKDCSNRRCRTCCKSRGFDCPTHVKSTWVPAARRRERQLMQAVTGAGGSTASTSGAKKPKLISSHTTTSHTSTSNTTPPRSFDTSSSHQDAGMKEPLPGQIRAPAVFKCVKVTAVEDGEDEYAYQAVVKIGGHVFKGFLYDQGVENRDVYPNLSELHLGGGNGGNGSGGIGSGRNVVSSSSPMMDPSDVYGGGLLGSSTYGNPIN
ncbi:hypothetical protein Lal_00048771 [Lupinus albus]|nr:hypothetical protein Lal_00048771 [Lupinus albus]